MAEGTAFLVNVEAATSRACHGTRLQASSPRRQKQHHRMGPACSFTAPSSQAIAPRLPAGRHIAVGQIQWCSRWRDKIQGHPTSLIVCYTQPKGFGKPPAPSNLKKASAPARRKAPLETPTPPPTPEAKPPDEEDDVIPEVVTNRILKRLVVTVGIPLVFGLGFFPLFYYLKVVQKVEVPDWLPLVASTMLFGLAGLGISYGVMSASWDPEREGTLLGWKEAKANWPLFTQTLTRRKT